MKPGENQTEQPGRTLPQRLFAGLFGAFLGLALLKFGNPVVFASLIDRPVDAYEWILNPWPIAAGYWMLGAVAACGLFAGGWRQPRPVWLTVLPLAWFGWQLASAKTTMDAGLTRLVLQHFGACVACFYLGLMPLRRAKSVVPFFGGLFCGFLVVLGVGFYQHFGGLQETREFFYLNIYPRLKEVPSTYLAKISSDRIFATLFYPNALAGVLLLLLPPLLALVWERGQKLAKLARGIGVVSLGLAGLVCLYWSGSKGGWLLMLLLGLIYLFHLGLSPKLKLVLAGVVVVTGMAGFFWRYSAFFQHGAMSVSSRLDYWQAAVQTTVRHPIFGTGPGTFAIAYKQIKHPESEMAQLAHNDYLQQGSDSGLAGFALYIAFIAGGLVWNYVNGGPGHDARRLSVWLGLLGWSLQSVMEFGLYIPALAWPAFALLGWLGGSQNRIDRGSARK